MLDVSMPAIVRCVKKWSGGVSHVSGSLRAATAIYFPRNRHTFHPLRAANATSVRLRVSAVVSAYTVPRRYFIPADLLELNEVDRRRLILAAEIYTETACASGD